jgi:hypothetical protein
LPTFATSQALTSAQSSRLAGEELVLGPTLAQKSAFVFLEEDCSTCKELLPELGTLADQAEQAYVWFVLEDPPGEGSPLAALDGRAVIAADLFREWKIASVPFAVVITEDGKVEAKGQLLGVGRLREELGLSARPADVSDMGKAVVA